MKAGRGAGVGIEIAVAVVGGLLLGHWCDGRFDTGPWLTLLGVVVGSGVGLRAVIEATKESG